MATLTLNERLAEAQREATDLRTQLANAEHDLNQALEEKDYAAAERLKHKADELRQPVLIAEAHARALTEGVQELERHRAEEQRAAAERERREQADVQYHRARQAEAEAMEDVNRYLAELPAAYTALRQVMQAAIEAEQRWGNARREAHAAGVTAGHIDPGLPVPPRPNLATVKIEHHQLLAEIWRTPKLS